MSISSIHLEAFVALAQELNFTRAASVLGVSQSALSQRILNLEDDLEVTLFIRERSGLKMTEAAFELIRYCQSKNHLEEEVVAEIKNNNNTSLVGTLRIGTFSSLMRSVVMPSIAKLVEKNGNLKLHLKTLELDELSHSLKRGEIDYMILDDRFEREDLVKVHLGYEENVLVKNKKYKGPDIYLDHNEKDLISYEYLKLKGTSNTKIERRFVGDIYGVLDAVQNKMGVGVIPKHLLQNVKNIEVIEPQYVLKMPVALYFYKQNYYSKLHYIVVDEITKNIRHYLTAN